MTLLLQRVQRISLVRSVQGTICAFGLLLAMAAWAQTPVVTWHYNNARTGADTTEVLLTPANVNYHSFGRLFTQPVDGFIIGHPLYLPGVSIPGAGVHDVVYVATMHDTVYAFDADDGNAAPLWKTSLLTYSPAGATSVPISAKGCEATVKWTETGVISTPVIDQSTNTMYLVAETYEGGNVVHRMHALDVTNGSEKPGWPVTIAANFTRNGVKSTFVDSHEMNRPGLLLTNGHVYVAFGGTSCNNADRGWLMSYNVSTAQQEGALDVEPGKGLASIWQKGAGISADADGSVYAETGEGVVVPGTNLGSSIFRVSQDGAGLSVADWFTPWNWATLNAQDLDLNNAVVILPDQNGVHPHEAVTLGKEGTIYLLDRDNLGQLCTTCTSVDTQVVQEVPAVATQGFTPVFWNGSLYITGSHEIQRFTLVNGMLQPANSIVVGSTTHPVVTANGNTNGILWFINGAVLSAKNALTLAPLYTTRQASNGRDTLPAYPHFASPVVADGKVFFGTQNSLAVYGLLPTLKVTGGNLQSATVGTTLPVALRAQAINPSTGKTVPGVTVAFSDGGKGGAFSSPTGVTDSTGSVSTSYTLPTKSGTYALTATAANYGPAKFSETAVPGPPTALVRVSGRLQTTTVLTPLPDPLVAKVVDQYHNGIAGVAVTFSDGSFKGTFSANPVVTDSQGKATVIYTAGPVAGNLTITARVPGLAAIAYSETIVAASSTMPAESSTAQAGGVPPGK